MILNIYTLPSCGFCERVKKLLRENNITFNIIDDKYPSGEHYPLIFLNGKKISYSMLRKMIKNKTII